MSKQNENSSDIWSNEFKIKLEKIAFEVEIERLMKENPDNVFFGLEHMVEDGKIKPEYKPIGFNEKSTFIILGEEKFKF